MDPMGKAGMWSPANIKIDVYIGFFSSFLHFQHRSYIVLIKKIYEANFFKRSDGHSAAKCQQLQA
jgi:hypothetical protein